jgi:hypothetical protein
MTTTTPTPAPIVQHTSTGGTNTNPGPVYNNTPATPEVPLILTKYQFRMLFTLNERVAIDNAQSNSKLTPAQKALLYTMQTDLNVSGEVDLHLPNTIAGVEYLVSIGLLTADRARQVLANQAPPAS